MKLLVDGCSYQAAKFAVEHWHYSHAMPAGKTIKHGVWEDGKFIGCIIYGRGSNQYLGHMFGLDTTQWAELCRVALNKHITPVTRMIAISLKMLKRDNPGLRLIISYADCDQDHHGGIYVAGGWLYLGKVQLNGGTPKFLVKGVVMHGRSVHSRWGKGSQSIKWLRKHVDPQAEPVYTKGKHKYCYPLDKDMAVSVVPLCKPYPKPDNAGD